MAKGYEPLTDGERLLTEFLRRVDVATRLLGAHTGGRLIYRTLYLEPNGWTIAALANEASMGESTVRRIVARNTSRNYMTHNGGIIRITPNGIRALEQVERETYLIAVGEQVGFSRSLIRSFADLGLIKNGSKAATIRFDSISDWIQ